MDIVYTWVNGSDPIHIENLKYYTNKEIENIVKQESIDDDFIGSDKVSTTSIYTRKLLRKLLSINNSTTTDKDITTDKDTDDSTISVNRFRDNSELKYSLRSLEKYAGWIRNIYIVTNGQVPNWLNLNNPKIHIITHKEIFPNPNDLPVFSSPSIESNIHRIKNLSKRFIYLNDDVMFGNFIYPEDFYSHSTGQKVFLSWDVPTCSPNCQDSWLGDGYCDLNCNTTECDYDGGDCIGKDIQLNRYGNSNYGNSNSGWYSGNNDYTPSWDVNNGNNYQISGKSALQPSSYCNSNCPNSWIGDRFCDRSCNVKECGFDSGDCDFENIRNYLPHLNITTSITSIKSSDDNNRMDSIYMLNNVTSFYLDFSKVFREITNGNYNNDNLIRTSTISQKEKLLIINLNYQNILMNFTNNKFSNEEVIITLEGKPIINSNSNTNNTTTTVNNNNGDNNNTKKDEVKIEVKIKLVTNDIFELIKKKVNDDKKKIMMIGVNKEMEKKINNEIFKESNLMNELKNHLENNLNDNDKQQQDDKVNDDSKENDAMNDIYNFLNDNINTNKDDNINTNKYTNNKDTITNNNNNKKKKENVNKKDNKKENVKNVKSEINELIKKLQEEEENDNITKNDKKQQQHVEEQMKVITNNKKQMKKQQQNIVNNKNKIQKQQQIKNNKKDKQKQEEEKQTMEKEEKDSLLEELGDIIKVPEQQQPKKEQLKKEVQKNRVGNNDITELTELLKAINQNEEEQSKKEEKEPLKEEEFLQPIKEKEEKKQEQVIIQEELGDIVKLPDQQQEQEQQNPNKKEEIEQKQEQQQQQQPNGKEEEKKLVKQEKQQQPKEEELENIVKQQQVKKEQQEQQQQPNKQKEEMKQQLKENNKNVKNIKKNIKKNKNDKKGNNKMTLEDELKEILKKQQEQPKENKENKKVNDEKTTNNKKQPKRKLLTISEGDDNTVDNTIINRNIKIIDKKEIQHSTRHIYLQKQQHLQKLKQMKLSLQEELTIDNTIIDNNSKNRKLLDKFSDSLIHVNKILNKEYGKIQRKVPAHMPHMINKEIMEELQNKWKNYFTITSSNRFRSSNDMQYSFTYFYYLMHEGIEYNSLNYFNENIDTNLDNELSDYEIRNICNLMLNKLSINIDKVKELYNNITITYNNLLPNKDIVNSSIKKKKNKKKNNNKKKNEYSSWFSKYYKNRNYDEYESGISNLIKLKVHKSENKYKYTLEDDKQIGFHMIRDDLDKVGEQLDELRRNKPKFICLNDDMNHTKPNEKVVEMLHNFYNWYFPNPSQFELNDGKINPYLYIDELNEHYRRLNYLNYLIDTIIFICCCCICCTLFICIRFLKRRNLNEKRKELTV